MEEGIPIGDLIRQVLKEQGHFIVWLAPKVHCRYNTLCNNLKQADLDADLLLRISKKLKHDFFAHYSVVLKEHCPSVVRKTNISENEKIFIGNMICKKLKEQERSIAWLSKNAPCKHSALCKILKRNQIDATLLFHISKALEYDFFIHYSNLLK
jgi:predicted transcriptional regulator